MSLGVGNKRGTFEPRDEHLCARIALQPPLRVGRRRHDEGQVSMRPTRILRSCLQTQVRSRATLSHIRCGRAHGACRRSCSRRCIRDVLSILLTRGVLFVVLGPVALRSQVKCQCTDLRTGQMRPAK
jgi:hypothetical protein